MIENQNEKFHLLAKERIKREKEYAQILSLLEKYDRADGRYSQPPVYVTGLCETPTSALIGALCEKYAKEHENVTSLVLCPDEKAAYKTYATLSSMLDGVYIFNFREPVLHNVAAFSHDAEYERLEVMRAINEGRARLVVTVCDTALYPLAKTLVLPQKIKLSVGEKVNQNELCEKLVSLGYTNCDTVEGKGQYSRRGDILDIFPICDDFPTRLEFFGDEIDGAGRFDILTQRRTENVFSLEIPQAREIILTDEDIGVIGENIDKRIKVAEKKQAKKSDIALSSLIERLYSERADLLQSRLCCLDKYISLICENPQSLLDITNGQIFIVGFKRSIDRIRASELQSNETKKALILSGDAPGKDDMPGMYGRDRLSEAINSRPSVVFDVFSGRLDTGTSGFFEFATKQTPSFSNNLDMLCDDLDSYAASKYSVAVCTQTENGAKTLGTLLSERGKKCVICLDAELPENMTQGAGVVIFPFSESLGFYPSGFELIKSKFVMLCEKDTEDATRAKKKRGSVMQRSKSAAGKLLSYTDLKIGDYVVHSYHGIARYDGIRTLTVDKITRDYITLQYAGTDVLYVPADQLDKVSRYASAGTEGVRLASMNSKEWTKTRARVKKEARDMAKKLIALYAARQSSEGFAFSKDTDWQSDFESRFEFEETEGQLAAVDEIKTDMERPYPMDRLLCGDVGFGKTEVALRAAFKCVADGKQAAILVPTTILAWQHFRTVCARMQSFPVRVAMLSRFCTAKEAKQTLSDLAEGKIDIIIGTHKLLQKNVVFYDLGLLIVDEEQRFGVAHKERLKEISKGVDVLTLTATPIPRTLNMAMSGIRDMSVLEEAPQDRYPVQTYVLEHDDLIIDEAIRKELRRGGQVFYLYNRVDGIEEFTSKLRARFPDSEIAFAHGKMPQEQLSEIWKSLVDGEIDILVCTTIIETGVDVPNANTLIIENADRLGLAQLHQIRGRIGRSNRHAYAYITWRRDTELTEIAQKRLEALREFTEFGSGFKIAMRDLEIRGAGTLLGAEQSGHMEDVGYDLYIKILEQAIEEERGEVKKRAECTVDIRENAYLPESFIRSPAQRIDIYKKIAAIENENDACEIEDELCDRFGDIPCEAENLIRVSVLRALGAGIGISKIEQRENKLMIYPKRIENEIVFVLCAAYKGRVLTSGGISPCLNVRMLPEEKNDVLGFAKGALIKYREALEARSKNDGENE